MEATESLPDVQIVMLGSKGSGKTCFLLAMYQEMRVGKAGFTFSAKSAAVDRQLTRLWKVMQSERGKERYPLRTSDMDNYAMHLNYAFKRYMSFDWIDYPGGVISLDDEEETKQDLQALLMKAFGLLICFPADKLLAYATNDQEALSAAELDDDDEQDALDKLKVGDINLMMDQLQHRLNAKDRPALVITATKFDLFAKKVDEGNLERDKPHWDSLIREYFPDCSEWDHTSVPYKMLLLEASVREVFGTPFARDGGWSVAIVPVTLGMTLAGDATVAKDQGRLRVVHMQLPLLYLFSEYARRLESAWQEVAMQSLGAIERHNARNRLMRWLDSDDLDRARQQLSSAEVRVQTAVERRRNAIRAIPNDITIYDNGERTSGVSVGRG